MAKNAMDRVVFEHEGVWYQTDYRFYKERLRHIVLPNGTLLEHTGNHLGSYMLSIPPKAFGFKKVEYELGNMSLEEVAGVHNATLATKTEDPF